VRAYLLCVGVYAAGLCIGTLLTWLGQRWYWRRYVRRLAASIEETRLTCEQPDCHAESAPLPPESPSIRIEPDGSYEDYR
jgi:hypothetical protein